MKLSKNIVKLKFKSANKNIEDEHSVYPVEPPGTFMGK